LVGIHWDSFSALREGHSVLSCLTGHAIGVACNTNRLRRRCCVTSRRELIAHANEIYERDPRKLFRARWARHAKAYGAETRTIKNFCGEDKKFVATYR
jgi:hypothetical protein